MIPQGMLSNYGAIRTGSMYIVAQFMLTAMSTACMYRYGTARLFRVAPGSSWHESLHEAAWRCDLCLPLRLVRTSR